MSSSTLRIPGLDGLRALAVLSVMAFHLEIPGFQLGWIGVELFFVISGFLITRNLFKLKTQPNYFRRFYIRRSLRIMPIYYIVIFLSVFLAVLAGAPLSGMDLPFYIAYLQNYVPQLSSSFSTGVPNTSHTWTLAVEEQFYWLWPILVLYLGRVGLGRLVVVLLLSTPLVRLALLLTAGPYATLVVLPSQLDALAFGAGLALLESRTTATSLATHATLRRLAKFGIVLGALSTAALVLVLGGLGAFKEAPLWASTWPSVLFLSSVAITFSSLVALTVFAQDAGRVGPTGNTGHTGHDKHFGMRVLTWRPLEHLGKISYGLYLYSPLSLSVAYAIFAILNLKFYINHPLVIVLTLGITYLVSYASWRYIESPLIRKAHRLTHVED